MFVQSVLFERTNVIYTWFYILFVHLFVCLLWHCMICTDRQWRWRWLYTTAIRNGRSEIRYGYYDYDYVYSNISDGWLCEMIVNNALNRAHTAWPTYRILKERERERKKCPLLLLHMYMCMWYVHVAPIATRWAMQGATIKRCKSRVIKQNQ